MNDNIQDHVIQLLKSVHERKQRIRLLRYELFQHTNVSDDDVIDSAAFGMGDEVSHDARDSHEQIFYIVLNYQKIADKLNSGIVNELSAELFKLQKEQNRLCYYISLLNKQEAQVIRLIYFDGCSWDKVAEKLGVVRRTAQKIRERALENLAWMYEYTAHVEGSGTSTVQ